MPIFVRWLDENRRILLTEYSGACTHEECQQALEERKHLIASIDYPVGIIENESQGYLVPNANTHLVRVPGKHTYTSTTDFSAQNVLTPNRIAVTIKIPYAGDTWQTEQEGRQWNEHSREKLRAAVRYPNLASVSVMMTIDVEEAQHIILDYLADLELTRQNATAV